MNFEILKGTVDSEPQTQIQINTIIDIIRKNFELYGFRPFDTPIIEYLDTLANKYDKDDEIVQEIFKLSDRGKRDLGLRYDLTVPLCRYISLKKQLKLPFKRYQVGKVFRDGPIKKGRAREFTQFDGDVIGIEGREIEAELLDMFYKSYLDLGINATIEINNVKILQGAFLQLGFKQKDLQSLILSIDKLKKIGPTGVLKEVKEKGFDDKKVKDVISILSSTNFKDIKSLSKNETLLEGIEELESLTKLLDSLKVNYRLNFSMSRGLNIYTGNIWESYDLDENISSSLGSGGRYDKAIGNFIGDGKDYPAVGVSFGIVPIMEVLKVGNSIGLTKTLIVPLNKDLIETGYVLANKVRSEGNNCEIYYGFKLKKAFDYAEYLGIEEVIIFGEKEVNSGEFKLKNLKSGKESKLKL